MANAAFKKIIPLMDRILVRRAAPMTQTEGGIVVPEYSLDKAIEGTVIAVGPGAINKQTGERIPIVFKAGDRVLLPMYGGNKVKVEDGKSKKKEYILFHEYEIPAKLEG